MKINPKMIINPYGINIKKKNEIVMSLDDEPMSYEELVAKRVEIDDKITVDGWIRAFAITIHGLFLAMIGGFFPQELAGLNIHVTFVILGGIMVLYAAISGVYYTAEESDLLDIDRLNNMEKKVSKIIEMGFET